MFILGCDPLHTCTKVVVMLEKTRTSVIPNAQSTAPRCPWQCTQRQPPRCSTWDCGPPLRTNSSACASSELTIHVVPSLFYAISIGITSALLYVVCVYHAPVLVLHNAFLRKTTQRNALLDEYPAATFLHTRFPHTVTSYYTLL